MWPAVLGAVLRANPSVCSEPFGERLVGIFLAMGMKCCARWSGCGWYEANLGLGMNELAVRLGLISRLPDACHLFHRYRDISSETYLHTVSAVVQTSCRY